MEANLCSTMRAAAEIEWLVAVELHEELIEPLTNAAAAVAAKKSFWAELTAQAPVQVPTLRRDDELVLSSGGQRTVRDESDEAGTRLQVAREAERVHRQGHKCSAAETFKSGLEDQLQSSVDTQSREGKTDKTENELPVLNDQRRRMSGNVIG